MMYLKTEVVLCEFISQKSYKYIFWYNSDINDDYYI